MKQAVNYLTHHKNVSLRLSEDNVSAIDISVYNALFMIWNISGYEAELSINRSEVMKISKVGNKNTYTASLHKLHEKGYIIYKPSHNPLIGSLVTITIFGNSDGKTTITNSGKSGGNTTGKSSGKSGGTLPITKEPINVVTPSNDPLSATSADDSKLDDLKTGFEEEKKKSSAQRKKEDSTPHWKALVSEWFRFYAQQFKNAQPSFDGEPASSLKKLINKIQKRVKDFPATADQEWDEGTAVYWLRMYLTRAYDDTWLRDNFLLTNLNSKFDAIVDRNGKSNSTNGKPATGGSVDLRSAFAKIDAMHGPNGSGPK